MLGKRIRHISRYREIATILVKYGFGFVVEEMGLLQLLSVPKRVFIPKKGTDTLSMGQRIRQALEELGPTFVKLGQLASTRADIIPESVIRELEKLQDQVKPFSETEVLEIIEAELGGPYDEIFAEFVKEPLAAASIGQVHKAILQSGESVVVKVQRPNIAEVVETDLEIILDLIVLAEHRLKLEQKYQLQDLFDEFARALRSEMDYLIEGRNTEKIAKQFVNNPKIHVPKIFWEYSTKKILTMEFIEGIKLNQYEELKATGRDCQELVEEMVKAFFQQILVEGFFHGDPHPGNIIIMPGDVVAFIDFGMVGRLTPEMKDVLASFLLALTEHEAEGMLEAIMKMGVLPDDVNMSLLRREIDELSEKYLDIPLSRVHLGDAVNDVFKVCYRHKIRIPSDLTLLGKVLLVLEGTVERLAPELSIIDIAKPFGYQIIKDRYRFSSIREKLWKRAAEWGDFFVFLPNQLKVLLRLIEQGRLRAELGMTDINIVLRKLDRIGNQISFSIVILSFSIIMSGLIVSSALGENQTILWKIPAIEIGFVIAALMFFWLLFSIFKSGRF